MNLEQARTEEWYVQRFSSKAFLLFAATLSGFRMKPLIPVQYTGFLFTLDHDYCSMYYRWNDLRSIGKYLEEGILADPKFLRRLRINYDDAVRKQESHYAEATVSKLKKRSKEELIRMMHQSVYWIADAVGIGHSIEGFMVAREEPLKERLKEYIPQEEFAEAYHALTAHSKPSFSQVFEDLLARYHENKDEHLLKKIRRNFFWILTSYHSRRELTEEYLAGEARSAKRLNFDFAASEARKRELFRRYRIPNDLRRLVKAADEMTLWQDWRKSRILKGAYFMFNIIDALAPRVNIDRDLLPYLLHEECTLEMLTPAMVPTLRKRAEYFAFTVDKDGTEKIEGEEAHSYIRSIESGLFEETELKGVPACKGNAVGRVRVCTSLKSLGFFREGEILVASMTRIEFVPAMKKAAAIITDEGGITCHAAVISRELNKPCIIGTKVSTRVFKDGDIVEVDATKGIVRKISNGER